MLKRIMSHVLGRGTFLSFFKKGNVPTLHKSSSVLGTMNRLWHCSKASPFDAMQRMQTDDVSGAEQYVGSLGKLNAKLGQVISLEGSAKTAMTMPEWYNVEHVIFKEWFKDYSKQALVDTAQVDSWLKSTSIRLNIGYVRFASDYIEQQRKEVQTWFRLLNLGANYKKANVLERVCETLIYAAFVSVVCSGLYTVLLAKSATFSLFLTVIWENALYWVGGVAAFLKWFRSFGGTFDAKVFLSDLSATWDDVFELNSEADVWLVAQIVTLINDGYGYQKEAIAAFGCLTPKQAAHVLLDVNRSEDADESVLSKISRILTFKDSDKQRKTGVSVSVFQENCRVAAEHVSIL